MLHCEVDVIDGLEPIAQDEINHLTSRKPRIARPGILQFDYSGDLRKLLHLKTVLTVYLVQHFPVPRPKALLGDQHFRALMAQIQTVLDLQPDAYRTFMLGAAGSDSPVMARLKVEIARHTGLREVNEEGDLLIRLRACSGWESLVRLSPRPLATRAWRVCNIEGSLQATVAHAMALLTHPKPKDVYLNLCCGSGTLLIERAMCGTAKELIGCDISPQALACAQANVAVYLGGRKGRPYRAEIELHDWDTRALPLPDASVDAITADLPFGHLVGSHADNKALYPVILHEAARVARPGARFIVITAEVKLMESALTPALCQWERETTLRVNLGGLHPRIYVLRKKS